MQPLVSISCLVYNHEPYLRRTLSGIMMQKTDFPFEVIVHDDASTDESRAIIDDFVKLYPNIIIPVYQRENQWTKRVPISKTFIYPLCRGEYIAFCEGDDFWSDPDKLQLQVNYMKAHPECSMCVHDTERVDEEGNSLGTRVNGSEFERDYSAREIIAAQGGGLFQTSAILCRRDAVIIPDEFRIKGIGDFSLAIYSAVLGKIHYLPRVMSCYRVHSDSWVDNYESNVVFKTEHLEDLVQGLRNINKATGYLFWPEISYIVGIRLHQLYHAKYGVINILRKPFDCLYVIRVMPRVFFWRIKAYLREILRAIDEARNN